MRNDITKVFKGRGVDHDLTGKGYKQSRRAAKRNLDDLPSREGMRRHHGFWGHSRYGGDNFSFIKKLIGKQVGRNWNDVWSDLCKRLDVRNFQAAELREYIYDYLVHTNSVIDNGRVYWKRRYGEFLELNSGDFYVHPETNILSVYSRPQRQYSSPQPQIVIIGIKSYFQYDGIWYQVEYHPLNLDYKTKDYFAFSRIGAADVFQTFKRSYYAFYSFQSAAMRQYGLHVYCTSKRQLNKQEIKRLKLRS